MIKSKYYFFFIVFLFLTGCTQVSGQSQNQDITASLEIYPENTIYANEPFSLYLILDNNGKYSLNKDSMENIKITLNGFSKTELSKEGEKNCFFSCSLSDVTDEELFEFDLESILLEDVVYSGIVPSSNKKTLSTTIEYPYFNGLTGTYCLSSEKEGVCSQGNINYPSQKGDITIKVNTKASKRTTIFEITVQNQGKGVIEGNRLKATINFNLSFKDGEIRCSSGISNGEIKKGGSVYEGDIKLNKETQSKTIICRAENIPEESFSKEFKIELDYRYKITQTQTISIIR